MISRVPNVNGSLDIHTVLYSLALSINLSLLFIFLCFEFEDQPEPVLTNKGLNLLRIAIIFRGQLRTPSGIAARQMHTCVLNGQYHVDVFAHFWFSPTSTVYEASYSGPHKFLRQF